MRPQFTPRDITRFWSKVDRSGGDDACWLWMGSCFDSGYGQFAQTAKINRRAHRVAYELAIGPIPDGMNVLHRCDNRRCCNPGHFFLVTHADNMADMTAKGRQGRRGHISPERRQRGEAHWTSRNPEHVPQGERHYKARLDWDKVREMRAAYAAGGVTRKQLAMRYDVHEGTVSYVLSGRSWKESDDS